MASQQTHKPNITPMRMLRSSLNKTIMVKVKEGAEFIGKLVMTDPTMNVVLEDATEYGDGGREAIAKYGRIFIRGSQILYVCVDYTETRLRQTTVM
ncbi:MAG: U6 snRNA-associated Sm-like protein LSm6 [Sulfolobales archaeon]|nr:U6 snRNA-associated Sm-like protein LSm6 [Ignisphaera sp.]MCX8199758.1 U6 snRNA-associated Sm-like protein LSm6 [Sulfolobales archaeon]MDW8085005.1 U6 snRNA-associated Sm-like protein LSm6 [Ignisphaera sp.]